MRKKLLMTLIVLLALLAGFAGFVAFQPGNFLVTRSITTSASRAAAFEQVNDFHHWKNWSPWAKLDPAMTETFAGPTAGTGASYGWTGNSEVGEGKMTITESKPGESVTIRLEFIKPFADVSEAKFSFGSERGGTIVKWTMTGERGFLVKAVCLFMNMEKMIGKDFEKGLAQLKDVVETKADQPEGAKP